MTNEQHGQLAEQLKQINARLDHIEKNPNEGVITQSVEASTATTQETLKPVIEKIEEQTRNLDVIYQQSEAFELYLTTLPANQREKRRAELLEAAKKQKAAREARRQAD